MLWFKHWHNLRNAPPLKYIQNHLGDHGFAAAIRLLEVLTERCGSGANFNPVLTLSAPLTDWWLANEILSPELLDRDPYTDAADDWIEPTKRLEEYLSVFAFGGLINRGIVTAPGQCHENGKLVEKEVTLQTIELCNFEEMQDTWTARFQHAGRGQGKGGGRPNY
jgi:hypothetical protein